MKLLKKIFTTAILLFIIGAGYYYKDTIIKILQEQYNRFAPCSSPVSYSVGTFDTKFNMSKPDFIATINQAEKIWEDAAHKELFRYVETGGALPINLVYDSRQASTDKLRKIGIIISDNKESYNALKTRYNSINATYNLEKKNLELGTRNLAIRQSEYEKDVNYWNAQGGAPKDEYEKLQAKRDALNALAISLNEEQAKLNNTIDIMNALGVAINQLIKVLNLNVTKFNTTSVSNGEEFEEGEYVRDVSGQRINVYEFSDKAKLIRVLIHELGHALGLMHVEDPKAIMYRLNEGISDKLTGSDIAELKSVCHLK